MKRQKRTFNELLLRYRGYGRKLQRLQVTGRNIHRQSVLKRHLEKLYYKLDTLYASIKLATVTVALSGAMLLATPEATAQEFHSGQFNQFGLEQLSTVRVNGDSGYAEIAMADLDGDGDQDILVGDYYGNFYYFENTGDAANPSFGTEQQNPFGLTNIGYHASPSFVDFDEDGDLDVFSTEYDGAFAYFENIGDKNNPDFTTKVTSPFGIAAPDKIESGKLVDMDGDDDLDLLAIDYDGHFTYFENTAGAGNYPAYGDGQTNPFGLTQQPDYYPTVSVFDIDQDGDMDVIAANEYDGMFRFFENTAGEGNTPIFTAETLNPFRLQTADDGNYSYAVERVSLYLADLDNDGYMDIMGADYNGNFQFFEQKFLDFKESVADPFSLSSENATLNPVLFDLDLDGDLDLISGESTSSFLFFENDLVPGGSVSFASEATNPFELTDINITFSAPYFADMDGDGDYDMMSGGNRYLFYFENIAGEGNTPEFDSFVRNPFSLDAGYAFRVKPAIADLDDDGDMDILIGTSNYGMCFFENTADPGDAPAFGARQDQPFGLDHADSGQAPRFYDYDGDGDLDIFSGLAGGGFNYYENIGTKSEPLFDDPITNPFGLSIAGTYGSSNLSVAAIGDVDNDDDIDIIAATSSGDFFFFEREAPAYFTSDDAVSVGENLSGTILDVNANDGVNADDVEISYALSGGIDVDLFNIDSTTGAISFKTPADYENPLDDGTDNIYDIEVAATSVKGTAKQDVAITVTDVEEMTTAFTSANSNSVVENLIEAHKVRASESDTGGAITYSISGGVDQALFSIDGTTGVLNFLSDPDYENPADSDTDQSYVVEVEATDGTSTINQTVTVSVTDENDEAPVFTSTASPDVEENTASFAIETTDADAGAVVTYAITGGIDESLFTIDENTGILSFVTPADYEVPSDNGADNVYDVEILANDGVNETIQSLAINITNIGDEPPKFITSAEGQVAEGNMTLDAIDIDANDGDGTGGLADEGITYSLGGLDAGLFTLDSESGVLAFIAYPDYEDPQDANGDNIYELTVTADDGVNQTAQLLTFGVNDQNDNAPQFSSSVSVSVAENEATAVTVTATDVDTETTFAYSIVGGANQALFTIDAASGVLTFGTAPDYDAPSDSDLDNTYEVQVRVDDGTNIDLDTDLEVVLVDEQTLLINVENVVESDITFLSSTSLSMVENQSVPGKVVASRSDHATGMTYSITGGADQSHLSIDAQTGELSFNVVPNYEFSHDDNNDGAFVVEVTANDGSTTKVQEATVTITDINEAPIFYSSESYSINEWTGGLNLNIGYVFYAEDEDGDALTYTLVSGDDYYQGGATKPLLVQSSGTLYSPYNLDFEAYHDTDDDNIYPAVVQVSDGEFTDTMEFTFTLLDVNEYATSITSGTTASVAENTTSVITVTASDSDGTPLTFSISGGGDADRFQIDENTGELSFVVAPDYENPLDANVDNDYLVEVTAGNAGSSTTSSITVTVTDVTESVIAFTSPANANVSVNEGSIGLTTTTIRASETDDADVITYSISGGDDQDQFEISSSIAGAVLSFLSTTDFENPADSDGDNVYLIDVDADDGTSTITLNMQITVLDTNDEVPVFTSPTAVSVAENQLAAQTLTATDSDAGSTLTYSLAGYADHELFNIDTETGVITFITAPDFENPQDIGNDNVYNIRGNISDGINSVQQDIAVTVTDVVGATPLTVTADDQSKTYGNPNPQLTLTYSGFVDGDTEADLQQVPYISHSVSTSTDAGDYTLSVSGGADEKYAFTYVSGTFTVNKKELTAMADDRTIIYGDDANTGNTVSYAGFVNNETEAVLGGTLSFDNITATNAGSYMGVIVPSGLTSSNYNITFENTDLTINKAAVSVTLTDLTITYDGGYHYPTVTTVPEGISYIFNREPVIDVASYELTATIDDANYEGSATETFVINPATLTVAANDQSKTYGDANPVFNVSYSGFVNEEDASVLDTAPLASSTADASSAVGTYAITISGGADNNYIFSFVDGTLIVDRATLTVTADDQSKVYGAVNPTFTMGYTGFVNGEDVSAITVPSISTTATTTSDVGTYPITLSGGDGGNNYSLSLTNGTLTIGKINQTITFDALEARKEGDTPFTLNATASSGLAVTFSSSDESIASISGDEVTIIAAGTVIITASQAGDKNFNSAATIQELVITKILEVANEVGHELRMYPNPATDQFVVVNDHQATLKLFDMDGTLIKTGETNVRIDVSGLGIGMYLIVIDNQVLKLVINR